MIEEQSASLNRLRNFYNTSEINCKKNGNFAFFFQVSQQKMIYTQEALFTWYLKTT